MQQTSTKGVNDQAWMGGKGDPLEIVQGTEIWSYYQMVYAQTRIRPRDRAAYNSLGF